MRGPPTSGGPKKKRRGSATPPHNLFLNQFLDELAVGVVDADF